MENMAKDADDKESKANYYQIALWLRELQEFRMTYEMEKSWNMIDDSTGELIMYNLDKRGCI